MQLGVCSLLATVRLSRHACACCVQTSTSLCVDGIVTSSAYDAMGMCGVVPECRACTG